MPASDRPPGTGRFALVHVDPAGVARVVARGENTWDYSWGDAAARLFAAADPTARLTFMYVEYANLASPGAAIDPPTVARSDGLAYYQGLAADPVRDYLRVPLIGAPNLDRDPLVAGLPAGLVNRLNAAALAVGTQGVCGKPFGPGNNSTITGMALIAARDPGDPSRDVPCFRGYYAVDQQRVVPPSGVYYATYTVTFP